ncbi:hypothetical protein NQ317_014098, partial [Molorchus minor]
FHVDTYLLYTRQQETPFNPPSTLHLKQCIPHLNLRTNPVVSVPVACSTVTVTKCQAALRTLQAFPFFKPTCLCREPHVDPECNSFRDFLFDHPCVFVMKKEKDPYPVDALPTCNHALSVCQQEHKCIKLYEDFKANCKVRDNRCRMDDRDLCFESWTNLRKSPMFGCICPNNHMKKRCDRIFSMVNHNPCVGESKLSSGIIPPMKFCFYHMQNLNTEKLKKSLSNIDWENLYTIENTDLATDHFVTILEREIQICTTKLKINSKVRKRKEWITEGLVKSINKKKELRKQLIGNPENTELKQNYKNYRNKVTGLIKLAKATYYKRQVDENPGDAKSLWKQLTVKTNNEDFLISSVNKVTYLGVILDQHLRWDAHIQALKKKLRYVLCKIKYIRNFLNIDQLKIIYFALVESHLSYGIITWGAADNVYMKDVSILQRRILKSILNKENTYSSDLLHKDLGILDLKQLFYLKVAVRIHKEKSSLQRIEHCYGTRSKERYVVVPMKYSTKGQHSYHYLAPKIYNSLPETFAQTCRIVGNTPACTSTDSVTGTGTSSILGTNRGVVGIVFDSHLVEESLVTSLRSPSELDETEITASDNASASFDDDIGNAVVENPLVDAVNGQEAHAGIDHISVSVLKNREKSASSNVHRQYPEEAESAPLEPSIHHHQKYPSPPEDTNEIEKMVFQSTCHTAMTSCNGHYHCRMLLAPILLHCDMSRCNRNSCMEALQAFYGKPDFRWNVEIAFCLCKKTDDKQDACLIAQEKLHPVCAQRIEESPQPTCLHLAEVCRENKDCRRRLEYYEQSCAVDSVTKKCAGSPTECRQAILGILGTDLRTTCACKGTDMTQLYECLGWQRLLWVNPCVVESQKNFHMKKTAEQAKLTTTHPPFRITLPQVRTYPTPVQYITVMAATEASLQTRVNTLAEFVPPPQAFVPTIISTTSTTTPSTTTRTTTTKRTRPTTTTTTLPPRSCVVQRPQFPNTFIREGSFKRIYHEDEFECSDVCECEVGEKLSCRTICIDRMPCKTEFAFYNHAAPAYQAFRGRCLCYSGRFICMKPLPSDYTLPQGIYLFLGYSEVDEKELNRNHTVVVIQDIVRVLQKFIEEEAVNGVSSFLITKLLNEECAELLEIISDRINARHQDFMSHLLLSIFKLAEVEIIQVDPSSSSTRHLLSIHLLVISIFLTIFTQNLYTRTS